MSDELPVHISREDLHAIEVPPTFETDGTFDVVLANHGTSLHVHLHLDDRLSDVASIDASNHYVEGESQRAIRVTVDGDRIPEDGTFGKLKIVSAYGSETRWVDVELEQPPDQREGVQVDESLGQPQPDPPSETTTDAALSGPELPVVSLGAVALVIAILVAVLVQDAVVTVGAIVVLGGVLVALTVLAGD